MKNIQIRHSLILIILFIGTKAYSQRVEFTPFLGYTFGSNFRIDGGRARISDGNNFGGILGFNIGQGKVFEFMYRRQVTNVYANSIYLLKDVSQPATVNYYLLGPTQNFNSKNENLKTYAGFKVGWATINPRDFSFVSITRFNADFSAGIKYKLASSLALNLGCGLNFPIVGGGTNLWWSPGGGTSVSVGGYVPMVQFNTSAGMNFKL